MVRATVRAQIVVALTAALGLPNIPPVAAQQDTIPAEQPFVPGGVYDKPYLTTLLGRTALGGYAEAHARLVRVDGVTEELGFDAKRFNLFTSTRVSDFVRIGAELEIEEGGEEIKLEYAAIDVLLHPVVTLRGGMILAPLGRFNLAHDSPRNEFTDRPLVSTELLGVALSEAGLGLLGLLPVGRSARVTYEFYAVNGFGEAVLVEGPGATRIPLGRQSFEDENRSPAPVGRLAMSPRPGWEIGLSAHHGAYTVFGGTVYESTIGATSRSRCSTSSSRPRGSASGARGRAPGSTCRPRSRGCSRRGSRASTSRRRGASGKAGCRPCQRRC